MPIIWLASYPKSGNTWTRSFLANYRIDQEQPVDINELGSGMAQINRTLFDETMGMPSADMSPSELERYRPKFHTALALEYGETVFLKTHSAFFLTEYGKPFFPPDEGCRAIHIVRNPLDVAVSFAHHNNKSVEHSIDIMSRPNFELGGNAGQMGELMFDWSGYCRSWAEQDTLAVLNVRYEDMQSDPEQTFGGIVNFIGLELEQDRLKRAIKNSSFESLKKIEQESNFNERQPTASSFFRQGKVGSWRESLNAEQVKEIYTVHREMMDFFDYNLD